MQEGEKVAGLVLAAGAGRRYGGPKAFDFLQQALTALRDGGCDGVFAVLGAAAGEVRAAVDLTGVEVVENPGWDEGMGSSLRAGLAAVADAGGYAAVCVHLVDMPGVTGPAVARVLALAAPGRLARASFAGVPGHPVLVGREHWAGVRAAATGDRGAREYLKEHSAEVVLVECGDIADGRDVDVR